MLRIAEEVRAALEEDRPVVALESTIIAHGLPYPASADVARDLEANVRLAGAVPATIAVIDGAARVGLDGEALLQLARHGGAFGKAGAHDLAAFVATRRDAATTVSGTLLVAARAGIRVVATGGIGGVHRGGHGDISNDLSTLANTPAILVSSGAKAILDLPRTLEALETFGVLVVGYKTDELPAFYTRRSGLLLDHRVDTPRQVAALARARFGLGQGGVLLANPIPRNAELDPARIELVIDAALADAELQDVRGKALTPFLLDRIARDTGGATVTANRALAMDNARVAAEIACAFAAP